MCKKGIFAKGSKLSYQDVKKGLDGNGEGPISLVCDSHTLISSSHPKKIRVPKLHQIKSS